MGRAEAVTTTDSTDTAEGLADALTAEGINDYLFTHDGTRLIGVSTDSTAFTLVITLEQADVDVNSGRGRNYAITQTPAANGEVWILRVDGPGSPASRLISTVTSAATNILDDLVAAQSNSDYLLIRGAGNLIYAINRNGDAFGLELVIDSAAAVALTGGPNQDVEIVTYTGASIPAENWNLKIKSNTGSGEFETVVSGGGATLAARFTALSAGTLTNFTFTPLATELVIARNNTTNFEVQITRDRAAVAPANITGTTSLISLAADSVKAHTQWTSTLGATSTDYVPADDESVSDIADGIADDINAFTGVSAISDGDTVIIVKESAATVTPTVLVSFVTPAPVFSTQSGTVALDYVQTITLEPAVAGDSVVTNGDRWTIDLRGQADLVETATATTNLTAVAATLEGMLTGVSSSSSAGNVITFNKTGSGVIEIGGVEQRNRRVEVDGTGRTSTNLPDGRDYYTTTNVTLAGNWAIGTLWTATVDGRTYTYEVQQETGRPDTLATVAFKLSQAINDGLPGAPTDDLKATAAGSTLTITKRGTAGSTPDEPFTFGISRSTGTLEILVDLDNTKTVTGRSSFTTYREEPVFSFLGTSFTQTVAVQDTIDFVARPTVSLYRVGAVGVPTLVPVSVVRDGSDSGSTDILDTFNEYSLGAIGEYAIVIGSEVNYNNFSNVYGVAKPAQFQNGVSGVVNGQGYSAIVSIPGQVTNQDAVTLIDTRIDIVDGTGRGQTGTITAYDPAARLYTVAPLNGVNWGASLDNTSFFNISETTPPDGYEAEIIRDDYTIVLSGAPVHADGVSNATVTIEILPERTRTYNSDEAFNPVVYYGEQQEKQVRVATKQSVIRTVEPITSDWTVTLTKVGGIEEVVTADTMVGLAAGIAGFGYTVTDAATGAAVTASTTEILITDAVAFFTGLDTGAGVTTYAGQRAEVEFSGMIQSGQIWTLALDGLDQIETTPGNFVTAVVGKTLEFRIVNRIDNHSDLGRWIQSGDTFTYTVLANSGPRISGIAETFRQFIDSDPLFSEYNVERFGRILRVDNANGMNLDVSVNGTGDIEIRPTLAQAVQQVVFDSSNWNIEQTVIVEALDDLFIDGGDALVFAPIEERINSVRGPLTINGGFGQTDERFLNNPVMYPGETNEPLADGGVESFGSVLISELVSVADSGNRAYIEDILASHRSASTGLRPGFDPRMNDYPYTVEFLNGRATGAVYQVLPEFGVSKDIFSIGNKNGLTASLSVSAGILGTYFDARVTTNSVNSGINWKVLNYTFSGSADNDETWTVNLPGASTPYTVTLGETVSGTKVDTLGRVVFALRDKVNAGGIYDAEVRVGLLGEVNLILSRKDGAAFTSTLSRSGGVPTSTPINETVVESGFTNAVTALPGGVEFTSVAYFAKLDADFSALAGNTVSLALTYRDEPTAPGMAGTLQTASAINFTLDADPTVEEFLNALSDGVSAIVMVSGDELGEILKPAISGRRVTFETNWLVDQETGQNLKPFIGDDYYYAPFNANFDVEETDQVDILNIYNGDSPSNDSGVLSEDRLTGFGIGGDTVISGREIEGGIKYVSLEELNFEMGSGDDSLVITDTHAGKTTINAGAGDDRIAVATTSGTLNIEGDLGNDTLHVATSEFDGSSSSDQARLEIIMGHLVFDGGEGVDRMIVDDSNDGSSESGILTGDSLTGFGFGSVSEVQTLTVIGQSGFYRISRGDVNVPWYYIRPGVSRPGSVGVVLDVRFTAAQIQEELALIYGSNNVAVNLISEEAGSKTYGIAFIGQLAGADITPIRWADPGPINLVPNGGLDAIDVGGITVPNRNSNRAEIIIGTRTAAVEDPSGGNTQQFLEVVNADRGTFTITLLDQTTAPLPFDITLKKLIDALEPILNPNNSNPSKPFTNNFDIEKFGSRFLITFKGEHRDLAIDGVDVDVSDLRGGTVKLSTRESGLSYFNLEQFDLRLGDGANILNVQGTSATTNLNFGGGDDEIYVSSLSDIDFTKRQASFIGNLDGILGTLNIDGGSGDQLLLISDAASITGDIVSITDRLPSRGIPGEDLSNLDRGAELFVIGASPAPISIQASRVEGTFKGGFRIETGSGDDTVNITSTISRLRIADAAVTQIDTGLGNDDVFVSLSQTGNSPLIIRTQGEYNYRVNLRGGLNIADLTNPEDEIAVLVDGVRLTADQFRAVLGQNAIDVKISGDLSPNSVVEVQLSRVNRGRLSEVPGQLEYVVDYQLRSGETVELFSAGQQLRKGADYFFYQLTPNQFNVVFNGRFNFFRNGDIVWEATNIVSESQTVIGLGQRDNDFVNAAGSTMPLTISTGGGDDVVIGGQGDDVIHSGRGNDTVFGRSGSDTIHSVENNQLGLDQDIIFGDDGLVTFETFFGTVVIDSRSTGQKRLPVGDYRLLEVRSVDAGAPGDDVITSGRGSDILIGGLGSDILTSTAGDDILIGDSGRVAYNLGNIVSIESTDSFYQLGTNDTLLVGAGASHVIGGLGDDRITTGEVTAGSVTTVLGDLGRVDFSFDAGTGINAVSDLTSSYPGLGGADQISLSPGVNWVIAGGGADQVDTPAGAFVAMEIGRLSFLNTNSPAYFEWTILSSPESSTGGTLLSIDGYLVEETFRPPAL